MTINHFSIINQLDFRDDRGELSNFASAFSGPWLTFLHVKAEFEKKRQNKPSWHNIKWNWNRLRNVIHTKILATSRQALHHPVHQMKCTCTHASISTSLPAVSVPLKSVSEDACRQLSTLPTSCSSQSSRRSLRRCGDSWLAKEANCSESEWRYLEVFDETLHLQKLRKTIGVGREFSWKTLLVLYARLTRGHTHSLFFFFLTTNSSLSLFHQPTYFFKRSC